MRVKLEQPDPEKCSREEVWIKQEIVEDENVVPKKKPGVKKTNCPYCGKIFKGYAMKLHLSVHTGDRPFKCDECPKAFKQPSQLNYHKLTHKEQKGYKCDICEQGFKFPQSYQRHMKGHQGLRRLTCKLCMYQTQSPEKMRSHKCMGVVKSPRVCEVCQKSYPTKRLLMSHMPVHEKKVFCEVCSKPFARMCELKRHLCRVHSGSSPRCDFCDFETQFPEELARHEKHHVTGKKLICSICGYIVYGKHSLTWHKFLRMDPRSLRQCHLCDYRAPLKGSLSKHVINRHKGIATITCSGCDKIFLTEMIMQMHFRDTHRETKYQCKPCSRYFTNKMSMDIHQQEKDCSEKCTTDFDTLSAMEELSSKDEKVQKNDSSMEEEKNSLAMEEETDSSSEEEENNSVMEKVHINELPDESPNSTINLGTNQDKRKKKPKRSESVESDTLYLNTEQDKHRIHKKNIAVNEKVNRNGRKKLIPIKGKEYEEDKKHIITNSIVGEEIVSRIKTEVTDTADKETRLLPFEKIDFVKQEFDKEGMKQEEVWE